LSVLEGETDRKNSHLRICLDESVDYYDERLNGFARYRLEHDALPEIRKADIDLSVELFGKKLKAPLLIGAMTGGTERAAEINRRLAIAAERCGVGFALGSQRKMLEDPSLIASYSVKKWAPNLPLLFGNVGAVQLNYGVTPKDIRRLVEAVECNVLNLHLNPLQEAIQPEGDTDFRGLVDKIRETISQVGVPVVLKEVGAGISNATLQKIRTLPVAGVETAGVGGTSWSKIESLRTSNSIQKSTGELFATWGVSTAESVIACRNALPDKAVIASGGIRTGIEIAKALVLGADAAAMALPMLKAAEQSIEQAVNAIERVIEELRVTMFVTGSSTISELKKKRTTT